MLYSLGYISIILALIIIGKTRKTSTYIAVLLSLSLWNIPLIMLGNSAAAGIFPVDFGLLFIFIKLGLKHGQRLAPRNKTKLVYKAFFILASYAILRTGLALFFDDYGYYNKFLLYGMIRWFTFILLFVFFCQGMQKDEQISLLNKIGWSLLFYLFFAVLHQFSIMDLSGLAEIGHGKMYQSKYFIKDIYRSYLGNNSASVGFIASVGMLFSLLLAGYANWKWKAALLFSTAAIALVNSGSRTDSVTILICFVWALIFPRSVLSRFLTRKMLPAFIVILMVGWLAIGDTVQMPGLGRLYNTNFIGEYNGTSTGTFAYRFDHWIIAKNYLFENPVINLLGFGINGYRLLSVKGYGLMGYGHNTFMHTWVELGIIGLVLFVMWLTSLFNFLLSLTQKQSSFTKDLAIVTLVVFSQRILSGITIDTFFATDNMLTMNVFILFFLGLNLQQKPVRSNQVR